MVSSPSGQIRDKEKWIGYSVSNLPLLRSLERYKICEGNSFIKYYLSCWYKGEDILLARTVRNRQAMVSNYIDGIGYQIYGSPIFRRILWDT